jgi:bacillithiol synthase
MTIHKLPYDTIPQLAGRDVAYIKEIPALRPFYKYPVKIESFRQAIEDKRKDKTDRTTLIEVLKNQHEGLPTTPAVQENIEKLASENTFTIVTAHQPSLFTGPLYYIFKIVSAINLAKRLNEFYPENHFVPIFISSGEDHDFEEINHLHLFNKTLTWDSGETGPTGWMKTASLQPVLAELKEILGDSENAKQIFQLIERSHTENDQYARAAFSMAHELFMKDGLVVLNTNDARLKRLFIPAIKDEIFNQPSHSLVNQTIERLAKAGFPSQATPRDINFFYLADQLRERIVEENGVFKVLNSSLVFSKSEMEAEIENHPERFSPNVVMRPIYQELILPNLAYIGGGGELAYWLERMDQFAHFGLNFPMLIRRNSAMWIDSGSAKRMEKLGLTLGELWEDTEDLIKIYLRKNAETEFHLTLEKEAFEPVFKRIAEKTEAVDPTLVKAVWAEHAKLLKSLEHLETKLVRAEKQKHDTALQQIRSLKEKLFPGNGMQERYDNFLGFYLRHGGDFFNRLKENFDPLEKKFVVFEE